MAKDKVVDVGHNEALIHILWAFMVLLIVIILSFTSVVGSESEVEAQINCINFVNNNSIQTMNLEGSNCTMSFKIKVPTYLLAYTMQ